MSNIISLDQRRRDMANPDQKLEEMVSYLRKLMEEFELRMEGMEYDMQDIKERIHTLEED